MRCVKNGKLVATLAQEQDMPITLSESLTVFGNSNHMDGFLIKYEKGIEEGGELEKPLTEAPNYYAWINIASEQVFYRIREMIYINTEDHGVFDATYKSLLDHLFSKHNPGKNQIDCILLFAKIRHLMVHKGFPNPHIAPSENSREIAKGYPFDVEEVRSLAERLQSPKSYSELHVCHRTAMRTIGSFEKEFVHNFGIMQISKKY